MSANLTTGHQDAPGTGFDTPSITPTANALILAFVNSLLSTSVGTRPTLTGNGLTWVDIGSVITSGTPGTVDGDMRWTVFRAMGAAPSAGPVSISFGATSNDQAAYSIVELTGVDTGGTNGSAAVVQIVLAAQTGGATSMSITLAAFADAVNNLTVGGFGVRAPGGTQTEVVGSGFTMLGATPAGDENGTCCFTEYKVGEDLSVDGSWDAAVNSLGAALEIKVTGGGPVPIMLPSRNVVMIGGR